MARIYRILHYLLAAEENGTVTVGIDEHALDAFGDIISVGLPEVGKFYAQNETAGVIESVKAAVDIYMPADGVIIAVNEALMNHPELMNTDPRHAADLFQCRIRDVAQLKMLSDETTAARLISAVS